MTMSSRRAVCGVLLLYASLLAPGVIAAQAALPRIVSSIRPLDLLVRAVAGDRVEARELPGIQLSPHDFVLRPSDLRLLDSAALMVWIGPALERPLGDTLQRMPAVAQLALQPALGAAQTADPHLWLDPRQAVAMARLISERLQAQGILDESERTHRLAEFERQMGQREAAIARDFAGFEQVPFLVMHDGYRHFVNRFGLNQAGTLASSHERQPGARAIAAMRQLARDSGAVCLLRSPGDNANVTATIAEGIAMHVVELDPLARTAPATATGFDRFLQDFAAAIAACLRTRATPGEIPA